MRYINKLSAIYVLIIVLFALTLFVIKVRQERQKEIEYVSTIESSSIDLIENINECVESINEVLYSSIGSENRNIIQLEGKCRKVESKIDLQNEDFRNNLITDIYKIFDKEAQFVMNELIEFIEDWEQLEIDRIGERLETIRVDVQYLNYLKADIEIATNIIISR